MSGTILCRFSGAIRPLARPGAIGLMALLSTGALASAPHFWVSPGGDDAWPGTKQKPFLTLERARDAVREAKGRQSLGEDIVVTLREGTYRLPATLVLDSRDSGKNGGQVVYRAEAGAHPVLSGAVQVQGWSLVDPALNIYRAYAGRCASRQLYVNGKRATRARTEPYPAGFRPLFFEILGTPFTGGIEYIPTDLNPRRWRDPSTWTNPQDVEAVIITQWKMMRVPLDSVTPYPDFDDPITPGLKTGLIVMQEPAWKNANVFLDSSTLQPGIWSFWQVTRFENAYEFLDEPGEWYLDRSSGWLYYIPRPGEGMATADVELPVLEVLVDGRGELGSPIAHLRFEGLTFSCATWLDPSGNDGYVPDQSGFRLIGEGHPFNIIGHDPDVVRTPGNVRFRFAKGITFHGNIFEHMGAVALDFDTGSQKNRIAGNLFEDVSSAAIQLGGVSSDDHHPSYPEQVVLDNTIEDNLIRQTGRDYVDAAGILVGFSKNTTIRHNTIVDVPWSGIAVGWGWGLLDPGGFPGLPGARRGEWGTTTTPTPNSGNRILHNRFDTFLTALWDGGAVYTTGQQGTSLEDPLLLKGNVASGKRPQAGSNIFYSDGGTRYVRLEKNVSYDNPQGVTDFGPPPREGDPLPYSAVPSLLNGLPYGTDRGGCRTYGDLRYVANYWINPCFYDPCPFTEDGVSYPTDVTSIRTHEIRGPQDVPKDLLRAAGVRNRPASIPSDRWILPPASEGVGDLLRSPAACP